MKQPLIDQAHAYVADLLRDDYSRGLVVALIARIQDLEAYCEAKDELNAELCARLQPRRTTATFDPYIAAKTAPRGEM